MKRNLAFAKRWVTTLSVASVGLLLSAAQATEPVGPAHTSASGDVALKEDLTDSVARPDVPGVKAAAVVEWCQTQIQWDAKAPGVNAAAGVCPTEGTCDTPSVRDTWIPDGSTPTVTLCMKFNVFAETDGSNPAATQADVDAQLAQLNFDFAPSGLQFEATTEFINDTIYRSLENSEKSPMKNTYADNPGGQLNVYVVNIEAGYLGVGTFPWDPVATEPQGGLIVDDNWFGAGEKTLTHETGHCVGLWHTHHGVSEVPTCSVCYERADGVEGDTTGDFASDTAPTPTNFNCAPPGGTDPCSVPPLSWGPTDPQNYMSYAPDSCYTEYSPHQFGRMHCWIDAVLLGWLCGETGACCIGDACSIRTEASCLADSGVYLGDGTDCEGPTGDPVVHEATVDLPIPDGGGPGNPATHTISVAESFIVGDVDVDLQVTHTWVGDLIATVSHGGTMVTVVDRPGYVEPNYGCAADNYDIVLDDEGTGGTIESQCFDYLSSPPNYTPNELLSAFDGMDAAGDWVIEVSDNAGDDVGTLDAWSIHLTEQGNPCAVGACCFGEVCIDGQPQDTCETTGVWMGPDTTCDCNPCIGIDQADPPSGTVDARQPHPVDSALPRQGIGSVDEPMTITLGEVGLEACFDLCETVVDPLLGVNAIGTVVDLGGGVYEIVLDHAITAGAVTTIQYNGDGSFVEYISHPANADADAGSAPADILVIIDVLNEVRTPVHGHYSQDIDHDGDYGPADILRLIDLLNGAGAYDSWLDVLLPQNTSCP